MTRALGLVVSWLGLVGVAVAGPADDAPDAAWVVHGDGRAGTEADGVGVDRDGNVFTAGVFQDTLDVSGERLVSRGAGGVFVVKHDRSGRLEWARSFGGDGEDNAFDLCVDPWGDVILSGWFSGQMRLGSHRLVSAGGQDMFLAKLDTQGRVLWAQSMGGPADDGGNEVTTDASGNVLATATSTGDFVAQGRRFRHGGRRDCYVFQLAPGGQLLWGSQFTGPGEARVRAIGSDGYGCVYGGFMFTDTLEFEGRTLRSRGSWDGLVVRWSSTGAFQGLEQLGGSGYDLVRGLDGDAQGNVYVSGGFSGTCTLAGETLTSEGRQDDYLLKVNARGRAEWIVHLRDPLSPNGTTGGAEVAVSASGDVHLSTKLQGRRTVLDPRGTNRLRGPSDHPEPCVLAFDTHGALRWSWQPARASEHSTSAALSLAPDDRSLAFGVAFRGTLRVGGDVLRSAGAQDKDFAIVALPVGP